MDEIEIIRGTSQVDVRAQIQLSWLLSRYDLRRWQFADVVYVSSGREFHEGKVAQFSTYYVDDNGKSLAAYLHSQLHVYTNGILPELAPALQEVRRVLDSAGFYANLPGMSRGQVDLEVMVVVLEYAALIETIGGRRSYTAIRVRGQHQAIYDYVRIQPTQLFLILERHSLYPRRVPPLPPVFQGSLPSEYLRACRESLLRRRSPPEDTQTSPSVLEPIGLAPGLTDMECAAVEQRYGFHFPPDLRSFLQVALPVGRGFPNWREADEGSLREWMDEPQKGICYDIEHNEFWVSSWGRKPESVDDACAIARQQVAKAPRLIPIFGHRYVADGPNEAGNPIFSVVQTDIISYGYDLADYLHEEFGVVRPLWAARQAKKIQFWSDVMDGMGRHGGPYITFGR